MPRVVLGNPFPIFNGQAHTDPNALTMIHVPETKSLGDAVRDIVHDGGHGGNSGAWVYHSWKPAPAWVSCTDWPELEEALAKHYNIPRGLPRSD